MIFSSFDRWVSPVKQYLGQLNFYVKFSGLSEVAQDIAKLTTFPCSSKSHVLFQIVISDNSNDLFPAHRDIPTHVYKI